MDNVVNELSVNVFNFKMKLTCIYKWQFIGYYFGSMTQLMLEVTLHRAKKILSENNTSTVKLLNFGTPEIFAVIYLKLKQRGQT